VSGEVRVLRTVIFENVCAEMSFWFAVLFGEVELGGVLTGREAVARQYGKQSPTTA
jgi:hypothetical protein